MGLVWSESRWGGLWGFVVGNRVGPVGDFWSGKVGQSHTVMPPVGASGFFGW